MEFKFWTKQPNPPLKSIIIVREKKIDSAELRGIWSLPARKGDQYWHSQRQKLDKH